MFIIHNICYKIERMIRDIYTCICYKTECVVYHLKHITLEGNTSYYIYLFPFVRVLGEALNWAPIMPRDQCLGQPI